MEQEPASTALPEPPSPGLPPIGHRTRVLVLQHPQEQGREIGTADLLVGNLALARRRIGLSWSSLSAAWNGRTESPDPVEPARWAVLYLGARNETPPADAPVLQILDRKGKASPNQGPLRNSLAGIVLLDGTWAQSKAMWWRNPWLLKLQRVVLNPAEPSRYGPLRREPRPGALSTLEAAALALAEIEAAPGIRAALLERFAAFLAVQPKPPTARPGRYARGRRRR